MEYSKNIYVTRQIKFPILCGYEAKIYKMKILALFEEKINFDSTLFTQKWEKSKTWILEHHLKDESCLKLGNWTGKIFYIILHVHF